MKPAAYAAVVFAALLLPAESFATQVTLTFDSGGYDPTIVSPSGAEHGPFDWIESGVRIAGFWAADVATPEGTYLQGHTHLTSKSYNPPGLAERTHSLTGDLVGLEISLLNGGRFDLVSLDYDVESLDTTDPKLQRLPWSFAVDDPKVVLSELFDPTLSDFESQWTAYDALEDGVFNSHDWHTLSVDDFQGVTRILISQTAFQTYFDNIVIDILAPSLATPEPPTSLLMGLGFAVLVRRRTSARA